MSIISNAGIGNTFTNVNYRIFTFSQDKTQHVEVEKEYTNLETACVYLITDLLHE